MDNGLTLADILGVVRRRWLLFVLPLLLGVPLSVGIALLLPAVYSSTARILVESQQIPTDLARSTVVQSVEERIQLIEQRLLTRQNLLEIAAQYNVFRNRPSLTPTEVVTEMRRATLIRGGTGNAVAVRRGGTVTNVNISFSADNAVVAAQVANEFVTRILSQNVQQRTERATGTLEFFNDQVARLSAELDTLSTQIAAYRAENQASLPETVENNQAEINRLRERSFAVAAEITTLDQQRRALQQALEIGRETASGPARTPVEEELIRLRNTLVVQRAVLADSHPTIRQLTARIAALEAAVEGSGPADAETGAPAGITGRASETLTQIEALESRIAFLRDDSERAQARILQLEQSLERAPEVAMELRGLQRRYDTTQIQLQDAVLKQAQAQTGERLEVNQQAERFEVIEQAIAAERPVSPNRPLIIAAGTAASGGFGVLLMLLAEMINRSLRTARDMERQLDMRPIITVPYIRSTGEEVVRRWRSRLLIALVFIGGPLAIFAVDQYVLPLPLVVERVLEVLRLNQVIEMLRFG